MSTDTNPARPGLPSWIWIAAAVVVVLLVAGGGYWFMKGSHKNSVASSNRPKLVGLLGDNATQLDNTVPDQDKICSVSLTRAMDFGVAPPGSTLVSQDAQATQPDGTYTCQAQTSDGKYTLGITTNCPGSQEKTCYALDTVKREDGQVIYHRES